MKLWSLPRHENLTTGKKYCGNEEKLLLRSNFSSFPQYFQYISNFKSPITYIFVKCGCSNYFFLNSANLICRGTDVSKYFKESLCIRDNESRLYYNAKNVTAARAGEKHTLHKHVKLLRKCRNHEAQPSRGTERRRDEEHIMRNMWN